jgi:hypothetical protein
MTTATLPARLRQLTIDAIAVERERFPENQPHPADVLAAAYDLADVEVLVIDEHVDAIEAYATELLEGEIPAVDLERGMTIEVGDPISGTVEVDVDEVTVTPHYIKVRSTYGYMGAHTTVTFARCGLVKVKGWWY